MSASLNPRQIAERNARLAAFSAAVRNVIADAKAAQFISEMQSLIQRARRISEVFMDYKDPMENKPKNDVNRLERFLDAMALEMPGIVPTSGPMNFAQAFASAVRKTENPADTPCQTYSNKEGQHIVCNMSGLEGRFVNPGDAELDQIAENAISNFRAILDLPPEPVPAG